MMDVDISPSDRYVPVSVLTDPKILFLVTLIITYYQVCGRLHQQQSDHHGGHTDQWVQSQGESLPGRNHSWCTRKSLDCVDKYINRVHKKVKLSKLAMWTWYTSGKPESKSLVLYIDLTFGFDWSLSIIVLMLLQEGVRGLVVLDDCLIVYSGLSWAVLDTEGQELGRSSEIDPMMIVR